MAPVSLRRPGPVVWTRLARRVYKARPALQVAGIVALLVTPALAQGVRERIRSAPRATSITESQANELTLTVTQVAVRPIQVWVRTAGVIDAKTNGIERVKNVGLYPWGTHIMDSKDNYCH